MNLTQSTRIPTNTRHGRRVVLIGNGMVGHHFCLQWVRRELAGRDELIVFGEEPQTAYDRIHLTEALKGGGRQLELSPREWYEGHGIALHTGDAVVRIDREARCVHTASGVKCSYDVLVLATGSAARVPVFPGARQPGVFVYRTLNDLLAIQQVSKTSRSAAVLGGGLLGLEAAHALQELGLTVHVVDHSVGLMSRQLDLEASRMLTDRVRALGLTVHLEADTAAIEAHDTRKVVRLKDGRLIAVDMVVMAVGVQPRDELAGACGLTIGVTGGVLVNGELQTSDPQIYAIGECAAASGRLYGIVMPGLRMAEALAANLAGEKERFTPGDYPVRLKLMGTDLVVVGDSLAEEKTLTYRDDCSLRQLVIRGNRCIGVTLLGPCQETGRLQTLVEKRRRMWVWQERRFVKTGSPWRADGDVSILTWPDDAVICQCTGRNKGELCRAVAQGHNSVEALGQCLNAGTVCGSCRPLLAQLSGAKAVPAARYAKPLLWASGLAFLLALLVWWLPAAPFAASVQQMRWDRLWLDPLLKQVSGFTLLGLMLLTLVLSARRRLKFLARLGEFGLWRALHAMIGIGCLLALGLHTGLRLGYNLNFVLMTNVLALILAGSLAGAVTALVHRLSPASGQRLQRVWTWVHLLLCWPLPLLVLFHILAVYRF